MQGKLLLLLILLFCTPVAAEPWIIEEDTHCIGDEMTVTDHITIKAGARLLLEDCVLAFDDGDQDGESGGWYNPDVLEGLVLHVEEGATLELRSVDRAAGLRAAVGDYAYRLRVDGELVMRGTPEHPVTVGGLEGYMLEQATEGGVEVSGTAILEHVAFAFNQGPSLLVVGGTAEASDVSVRRNSGAFAVREGGSLGLRDVDVNVGNIGVLAKDASVDMDNVTLLVQKVALKATRSEVVLRDSLLDSRTRGSAELTDTNLTVENSVLRFGPGGIIHGRSADAGGLNRIVVRDSLIEGQGARESMAITVDNVDLDVQGSVLRNYTWFGINHGGGAARLVDNAFEGTGKYHAYLGGEPGVEVRGNVLTGDALNGIVYAARVFVDVVDDDGPVANATVQLPTGEVFTTDAEGVVGMVLTVALDAYGVPVENPVRFTVGSEGRVRSVDYDVGDDARLLVDLDAREPRNGIPGPGAVAVLVVVALGAALRRR